MDPTSANPLAGPLADPLAGPRVRLRPLRQEDLDVFEGWGEHRAGLWGPHQRYQLDHVRRLREAFARTGLLDRAAAVLLVETVADKRPVGFVRYTMTPYPDADCAWPDIGFGIGAEADRGKGYATEAVGLLVDYLFSTFPVERVGAATDAANEPSRRLLEKLGFRREGVLRRASFRDGAWRDLVLYGLLRPTWARRRRRTPAER
ncbi:MAG TPA: GNAT family protein [Candidatus Binatia bacterium]|nr:GNAT family protein [Candidatus Binatia bacterium]